MMWWHIHAAFATIQVMIGAPLWYLFYIKQITRPVMADQITTLLLQFGESSAYIGLVTLTLGVFGAPIVACISYFTSSDSDWDYALLSILGVHIFPIQIYAVWRHRKFELTKGATDELD
jgi:hypothetical protein